MISFMNIPNNLDLGNEFRVKKLKSNNYLFTYRNTPFLCISKFRIKYIIEKNDFPELVTNHIVTKLREYVYHNQLDNILK